jgi:hypothetical protein
VGVTLGNGVVVCVGVAVGASPITTCSLASPQSVVKPLLLSSPA